MRHGWKPRTAIPSTEVRRTGDVDLLKPRRPSASRTDGHADPVQRTGTPPSDVQRSGQIRRFLRSAWDATPLASSRATRSPDGGNAVPVRVGVSRLTERVALLDRPGR